MIVSVTVLGGGAQPGSMAIGQKIVDYLEGGRTVGRPGRQPGTTIGCPSPNGGTVAYYADAAGERPGRWAMGRTGDVDASVLAAILSGIDPVSREPLLTARGTHGREGDSRRDGVAPDVAAAIRESGREWWSAAEVASALGVSPRYARRLLSKHHAEQPEGIEQDGTGTWRVRSEALATIAEARSVPRVVVGYDLTFSVPKSVSVLWAVADDTTRAAILDSIDEAVAAGLRYAQRHALFVRANGREDIADGVIAADYLHTTSRALEPQLHHHVVIANVAKGRDGIGRALDARFLFLHAKTIGYLSAAELRHQLTARLGVEWRELHHGIGDIEGVPEHALELMSTRAKELRTELARLGLIDEATGVVTASAKERQVAAWDTRAAKVHGVDVRELMAVWDERLTAVGYDGPAREAVLGRVEAPGVFDKIGRSELFADLVAVAGITENEAIFDRRRVVQQIAERAGTRLSGDAIDDLADAFLSRPEVVRLAGSLNQSTRDVIRLRDGRAIAVPMGARYSTKGMLALEQRALALYDTGHAAETGVVPAGVLRRVLGDDQFARLSDEQRTFVTRLVTSGMRVQAGVGAAGTGKTSALEAAVAAWRATGFTVLGTAVGGKQTIKLGEETRIDTTTVASILARIYEHGDTSLIRRSTVVLVDEASQLSTRDFVLLGEAVASAGATLRLIGDPAQHTSVAAGGVFRYFVEHHASEVPALTHIYRQQGPEMAEVRLANSEFREGKIAEALERLERDGRITEVETADEAYDLLTCAWYAERQKWLGDRTHDQSSMTAEHHFERIELNARGRALLQADGTLTGPELVAGKLAFQVGDEVVARKGDRKLRSEGLPRRSWVRNGSLGVVTAVEDDGLVVDFQRWGRVNVPRTYLEQQLSPAIRGGLQYAYALTSHTAEGETYGLAAPFLTDAATPAGTYVGLTRGRFDLRAVVVRHRAIVPSETDDVLPRLLDEQSELDAATRRLEASGPERLASELDPLATRVHALAEEMTLPMLEEAQQGHRGDEQVVTLYRQALMERARSIGLTAIVDPGDDVIAHLGQRPIGPERHAWDQAVSGAALWREREDVTDLDGASDVAWSLGERPFWGEHRKEYDELARLIRRAMAPGEIGGGGPISREPAERVPQHPLLNLSDDALLLRHRQAARTIVDSENEQARLLERVEARCESIEETADGPSPLEQMDSQLLSILDGLVRQQHIEITELASEIARRGLTKAPESALADGDVGPEITGGVESALAPPELDPVAELPGPTLLP